MQVVVNQRNHLGVVYVCADVSAVTADHNSGASSRAMAQHVKGGCSGPCLGRSRIARVRL
jgi:hypothetical protein